MPGRAVDLCCCSSMYQQIFNLRVGHIDLNVFRQQFLQCFAGDGDQFIGWGEVAEFSEFDPSGQLLFDGHFPSGTESYRDFRFAWSATPAHQLAFTVAAAANGGATAFASWNGATDVASWRVLAGPAPSALSVVAQAPRSGFETAIALPAGAPGRFMTVQAIDRAGAVSGTAAPTRVTVGG